MLATFAQATLAWVFFRATTVQGAFDTTWRAWCRLALSLTSWLKKTALLIVLMLAVEWLNRLEKHGLVLVHWRLPGGIALGRLRGLSLSGSVLRRQLRRRSSTSSSDEGADEEVPDPPECLRAVRPG